MDSFGRIAIFSDVHGNLEALQTVQKKGNYILVNPNLSCYIYRSYE